MADDLAVSDANLRATLPRDLANAFRGTAFAGTEPADYLPAVKKALGTACDTDVIVTNTEPPTFDNTIMALEVSGDSLNKVAYTFSNITGTDTNDELRALQTQTIQC